MTTFGTDSYTIVMSHVSGFRTTVFGRVRVFLVGRRRPIVVKRRDAQAFKNAFDHYVTLTGGVYFIPSLN